MAWQGTVLNHGKCITIQQQLLSSFVMKFDGETGAFNLHMERCVNTSFMYRYFKQARPGLRCEMV